MPPIDPWWILQALGRVYLWCLLALAGVCAAAVVIGVLIRLPGDRQ
jgi:hypothetical protein